MARIAIHGFGRIGRSLMKVALKDGLFTDRSRSPTSRISRPSQPSLKSTPITDAGTKTSRRTSGKVFRFGVKAF